MTKFDVDDIFADIPGLKKGGQPSGSDDDDDLFGPGPSAKSTGSKFLGFFGADTARDKCFSRAVSAQKNFGFIFGEKI